MISGCRRVPYFVTEKRYLSHGDDPYNAFAEEWLLDEATFKSWFPYDPNDPLNAVNMATACQHVGKRVMELAIWHFTDEMCLRYCSDKANGLDHTSGIVFAACAVWLHR